MIWGDICNILKPEYICIVTTPADNSIIRLAFMSMALAQWPLSSLFLYLDLDLWKWKLTNVQNINKLKLKGCAHTYIHTTIAFKDDWNTCQFIQIVFQCSYSKNNNTKDFPVDTTKDFIVCLIWHYNLLIRIFVPFNLL